MKVNVPARVVDNGTFKLSSHSDAVMVREFENITGTKARKYVGLRPRSVTVTFCFAKLGEVLGHLKVENKRLQCEIFQHGVSISIQTRKLG